MIEIGHHDLWRLGGIVFNSDTIISSFIVSSVLIVFAVIMRIFIIKNGKNISRVQAAAELVYGFTRSLPLEVIGKKGSVYVSLISTLFIYILFSNVFGLIPVNAFYDFFLDKTFGHMPELIAPTSDINTTVALAVIAFFSTHFFGIKERGIRYFSRFVKPNFVFLPLNLMEEISKPVSLAIRLFGNTFGKETIILVLVSITVFPIIYPIPILALGLFIGFVQAYIFALLTTFYIAGAISEGH